MHVLLFTTAVWSASSRYRAKISFFQNINHIIHYYLHSYIPTTEHKTSPGCASNSISSTMEDSKFLTLMEQSIPEYAMNSFINAGYDTSNVVVQMKTVGN